jgi:hypothetical protein
VHEQRRRSHAVSDGLAIAAAFNGESDELGHVCDA